MEEKDWVLVLALVVSKNKLIIGSIDILGEVDGVIEEEIEKFVSDKIDLMHGYIEANPKCNHVVDRKWIVDFNSSNQNIVIKVSTWNDLLKVDEYFGFGGRGAGGGPCR